MIISRSIYGCCKWHYFILFYVWVVFHCICVPHSIYPFIFWWTFRLLPCPEIVNSAAVNTGVHISFIVVTFLILTFSCLWWMETSSDWLLWLLTWPSSGVTWCPRISLYASLPSYGINFYGALPPLNGECISKMLSGFPHNSFGKESACNAGDPGSIPGSGRSPGEGNGNPLQYSCLGNPMDRGA